MALRGRHCHPHRAESCHSQMAEAKRKEVLEKLAEKREAKQYARLLVGTVVSSKARARSRQFKKSWVRSKYGQESGGLMKWDV